MNTRVPSSLAAIVPFLGMAALAQPCGNPWTIHQGPGPSAREAAAIAYDSARGKVVLFGGRGPSVSTIHGDTWEWTAAGPAGGGSWTQTAAGGPPAASTAAMAYDSIRQRTVLFGGYTPSTGNDSNQTWEWDGSTWTLMEPTQSPPGMAPVMAFDPVRGKVVLVSTIFSGPESRTTWEYDGSTWTRSVESTPVTNWFYDSMAYDAARSVMVMYSGGLWERTASGWQYVAASVRASSQTFRIAFDGSLNRIAFADDRPYSGLTAMWSWNASAGVWSVMNTNGPVPSTRHSIAYDAAGQQLLIFGGGPISGGITSETRLARNSITSGPVITDPGAGHLGMAYHGSPGILTVQAIGAGQLSYQWRRNGQPISDGGPYTGTQSPQLTINPSNIAFAGKFDAVITDSCGTTIRPVSNVAITCYPDCNGVGGVNAADFGCFLNAYNSGGGTLGAYANCDGSTTEPVLNANDFICFLMRYTAGCS
jgi:hypothetical protein